MARIGQVAGSRLRELRLQRGYSLRELADRTRELAGEWGGLSFNMIARIERGESALTVEKWVLLSAALDVPPLLVLLPLGDVDSIQITPTIEQHPGLALKWLAGEGPLSGSNRGLTGDYQQWLRLSRPLRLYQQLHETEERLREAEWAEARAARAGNRDGGALAELFEAIEDYGQVLEDMVAAGVDPPGVGPQRYGYLAMVTDHHPQELGVPFFEIEDRWADTFEGRITMRHPHLRGTFECWAARREALERAGWQEVEGD